MEPEARHQCMIYEGSPSLQLTLIASIIRRKLYEGYCCLYLNSAPMVAGLRSTLSSLGLNVESEIKKGGLILSAEPVSSGDFNSLMIVNKLEEYLEKSLSEGFKGLWASGDMTWEFGPERNFSKLMDYELKLEFLFNRRKELSGICQYHCDTLPKDAMRQSLLVHPKIVVSETISKVNPHYRSSSWPADFLITEELDRTITDHCTKTAV